MKKKSETQFSITCLKCMFIFFQNTSNIAENNRFYFASKHLNDNRLVLSSAQCSISFQNKSTVSPTNLYFSVQIAWRNGNNIKIHPILRYTTENCSNSRRVALANLLLLPTKMQFLLQIYVLNSKKRKTQDLLNQIVLHNCTKLCTLDVILTGQE